jgi:hypothetical protein
VNQARLKRIGDDPTKLFKLIKLIKPHHSLLVRYVLAHHQWSKRISILPNHSSSSRYQIFVCVQGYHGVINFFRRKVRCQYTISFILFFSFLPHLIFDSLQLSSDLGQSLRKSSLLHNLTSRLSLYLKSQKSITMRFASTAALALTGAIAISGLPAKRQAASGDIDPDILQFALTVSTF